MPKTISFDQTDPKNLRTAAHDVIVTAFAAVHAMDSAVWHVRDKYDAWEDEALKAEARKLDERQTALGALYLERFLDKCLVVKFRGNSKADASNYEVEDAMKEKFGTDGIMYDSESSWFFVDTTKGRREEVSKYLNARGDMDFMVTVEDDLDDELVDIKPPMIVNWNSSTKWLAEREITIDYTVPAISAKPEAEIAELLKQAEAILTKTGLSRIDAIEKLAFKMDVAIDGTLDNL